MQRISFVHVLLFSLLLLPMANSTQATPTALDTAKIEELTGLKGKLDSHEQVFKVTDPRTDLNITVAGAKLTPVMGFTSWAAFMPIGPEVMVMGDIVLTENQVNSALSAALDHRIEVTALHNHFLWETPRIMFMHLGGRGDLTTLANGIGKVFAAVHKPSTAPSPAPSADAEKTTLDPSAIAAILEAPGEKTGDVYKVTLGQTTELTGHSVGKAMGVNTWAAFAGSNEQAVVAGDFAMREGELQNVLKALRSGDFTITAIHHHMLGEVPKIAFLHYWGVGSVADLAKTLKSALATQAKR